MANTLANAIKAAMKDEWKPQPKAKGHKKACRQHRGGQRVREEELRYPDLPLTPSPRASSAPPANSPPPSPPSAEAAGPVTSSSLPVNTNDTAEGSPGVGSDLLSKD
ncbi:hypothetical protein N7519_007670 [Penicillium mononematosum]|uniref:uncharacterized protein n=1 Tax=Penicillium mononematosum TaxID=268346 RepID=UPI00254720EF|nr:uncharacterized protein N7519_007670 [Penicillium mononematosum]KAJ6186369.1 hypothetical protein N7519_007670 [Penicillium mononematosum]